MHDAGFRPETQAEVRPRGGPRRYLDFLFPAEGLAVEIEGYAYHGTREAHRRDVARFNQILQCPEVRRLLRFTAEDVFHRPTWMITEIRTTLTTLAR
jgi:very-short-patch-repair endonuclease